MKVINTLYFLEIKQKICILFFALIFILLNACSKNNDLKAAKKSHETYSKNTQESLNFTKVHKNNFTNRSKRENFFHEENEKQKTKKIIFDKYSLNQLKLVGIINQNKQYWALICAPDGLVVSIQEGDTISSNQAIVVKISQATIKVLEESQINDHIDKRWITLEFN